MLEVQVLLKWAQLEKSPIFFSEHNLQAHVGWHSVKILVLNVHVPETLVEKVG